MKYIPVNLAKKGSFFDDKKRVLKISFIAIVSVAIFQIVSGLLSNSLALITDGTHAIMDAFVTGILLLSVRYASKPPDKEHTYGHGKVENIGSLIGGISLFVISVLFIYKAIINIFNNQPNLLLEQFSLIIFLSIAYTLAVDLLRIIILIKSRRSNKASHSIRADLYHAIGDMISTFVILFGLLAAITVGFNQGDSIAAAILGLFLGFLSSKLVYKSSIELTDYISPSLVEKAKKIIESTEGIIECKDIKMRKVGQEFFIETSVNIRADLSFEKAHKITTAVENNLYQEMDKNLQVTVHFEPNKEKDIPLESIIETIVKEVNGVKGVHNVLIGRRKDTDKIYVSLHVQVDKAISLINAHKIANKVEESIKNHRCEIEDVVVHLEPIHSTITKLECIKDLLINKTIEDIVLSHDQIKDVRDIIIFMTNENILKIDIYCIFKDNNDTIEYNHKIVSEIENKIHTKYRDSIVTIHSEPPIMTDKGLT